VSDVAALISGDPDLTELVDLHRPVLTSAAFLERSKGDSDPDSCVALDRGRVCRSDAALGSTASLGRLTHASETMSPPPPD